MPKSVDIFESLSVKLYRAEHHINDLELAIAAFKSSNPYEIFHIDNLVTGIRTFHIRIIKTVPLTYSAIIGDAVQNMRSVLDHLASHLVNIGPGPKKVKNAYFPVYDSATEYHAKKMEKIRGASQNAIDAIDAVEPYPRGNGWAIYDLAKINNRDKHTLIIPAWASMTAHSFGKTERERIGTLLKDTFPQGLPAGLLTAGTTQHGFLEDGSELLTMPISEVEDPTRFRIEIMFGEPVNVRLKQVIPTLRNIYRVVNQTIIYFKNKGLI